MPHRENPVELRTQFRRVPGREGHDEDLVRVGNDLLDAGHKVTLRGEVGLAVRLFSTEHRIEFLLLSRQPRRAK